MKVTSFSPLGLLGADRRADLLRGITNNDGEKVLGAWCEETHFCVSVHIAGGVPVQWWISGPMDREQARAVLMDRAEIGGLH